MTTCLKMRDVSLKFKETKALDHLNFEVSEGEIFGFLGPSGAGKTTTMKALTKQLNIDTGEITLFGKDIKQCDEETYNHIGIISDSNDVYDAMSVYDNLALFAELRGVDKSEVDILLKSMGLYDDRKKLAKKLSRGMRQRLILATAIIHKPKLLFLDEPTASLDPKTTSDIHELFLELNKNGTTIFLTTHSMMEADKLCHRIAFLDQGSIVELGTSEELKLKYAHDEFVVRYKNKGIVKYPKTQEALATIQQEMNNDTLLTLHSSEPSLEEIFLSVTGRDKYESK